MSLKDIYTPSYYKKLRPKSAFTAAFSALLPSGRHTSTSFPKVIRLLASLTLGVQCLFVFYIFWGGGGGGVYFQPLAVSEQMEHGQSGGKRWKHI